MDAKKGQASGYLLLGIVAVLVVASAILIQQGVQQRIIAPQQERLIQSPVEKLPVQEHIEQCIYQVAKEGLVYAGKHGGYVDLRGISGNPYTPYTSDALTSQDVSSFKLPYWWYLAGNDCSAGCVFTTKMPALAGSGSLAEQLQEYVNRRLPQCVQFDRLAEQGYAISAQRDPRSTVIFGDRATIRVDWPLDLSGKTNQKLTSFETQLDVNLPKMWDLSVKIMQAELNYSYLEQHILNVIGAFSGARNDRLPPQSEFDFQPGPAAWWLQSQVKQKVQRDVLAQYIPTFQVPGTANFEPRMRNYSNPIASAFYNMSDLPIVTPNNTRYMYYDTTVKFSYWQEWPIYMKIRGMGGSGEYLTAESSSTSSMLMSWLGLKRYTFFYDISYPVMVEVQDTAAFDGEGYSLLYAMEGNIRANAPLNRTGSVEITTVPSSDMVCSRRHRNTRDIDVRTFEYTANASLDMVEITYLCGDITCQIGYTESLGSDAKLVDKFPICLSGGVIARKWGYADRFIPYPTALDENGSLNITLYPEVTFPYELEKKQMVKAIDTWTFNDIPLSLLENERAIISWHGLDNGYDRTFIYNGNDSRHSMTLVPGTYELDIQFLYDYPDIQGNTQLTIPSEEMCAGGECNTINGTNMTGTLPLGGVLFNNQTEYVIISPAQLYSGKTLTLYGIQSPGSSAVELNRIKYKDLEELGKREEYSRLYVSSVRPQWQ